MSVCKPCLARSRRCTGPGRLGERSPQTTRCSPFEDAIREFAPDHVLIGLRSSERSDWQERGLLDQVIARFGLPLTVFELDES